MAWKIKQHDTHPPHGGVLVSDFGGANTPIDLTDADTIRFIMATDPEATPKVDGAATVVGDPTDGAVIYEWVTGDTDTVATYIGEYEITWLDGTIQTVPNEGYFDIEVTNDIA